MGVKSDNVKQNQKYFVSSLESNQESGEIPDDIDIVDIIECDCNHMSIESKRQPDARLQTFAAFESLMQSDLRICKSSAIHIVFNVETIIPDHIK